MSLAGVDFLTISPSLLEELKNSSYPVPQKLSAANGTSHTGVDHDAGGSLINPSCACRRHPESHLRRRRSRVPLGPLAGPDGL